MRAPVVVVATLLLCIAAFGADVPVGNKGAKVNGKDVCENGIWSEEPLELLNNGERNPQVQCWRKTPCIRWSYTNIEKCSQLKDDADWPVWDPYLKDDKNLHSFKDLTERFFKNKVVFWTGDSIMNLVSSAAVCEGAKHFTAEHVSAFNPEQLPLRAREFFGNLSLVTAEDRLAGGNLFLGGPPHSAVRLKETDTIFVTKGWHKWKRSDMEAQMKLADIIVVNYAMHYFGSNDEYRSDMEEMLQQLTEFGQTPGKIALFRDTAAEHNAPYGGSNYLESETNHPTGAHGCQCQKFEGPSVEMNKARMLHTVVEPILKKYPKVPFIPWYDITQDRYDMHEAQYCAFEGNKMNPGGFCCDCTHFCYTPLFWKHFFSRLYDSLDKAGYSSS